MSSNKIISTAIAGVLMAATPLSHAVSNNVQATKDVSIQAINAAVGQTPIDNQAVNYRLRIITPAQERAYRKPAQAINVQVAVSPALRSTDMVSILVDGQQMATGVNASIPSSLFNPGKHTLTVQVKRADGSTSGSDNMTFYVIQNTQALLHKKQLTKQVLAYQRLPWHQKMWIHMQGKKPVTTIANNTDDAFR